MLGYGLFGSNDVFEGAFADIHEFTVTPVCTSRKVGKVVFAGVEEMALAADWEVGRCESPAYSAEEETTFVDVVSCLVHPFAVSVLVAS